MLVSIRMYDAGALYLKAAITGDDALAKNLCVARGTIGALNLYGYMTGALSTPFVFFSIVELTTVAATLALAPTIDTAAATKKRK